MTVKYRVKIVPEANPNEKGRWIDVELAEALEPGAINGSWVRVEAAFRQFIPVGFFLVQYQREELARKYFND